MFSGIIETVGKIREIKFEGSNCHLTIESDIAKNSYIDQSISHNGVCLTVVQNSADTHTVTAIKETMDLTNLGALKIGDLVNLERSIQMSTLMDGHLVQGHVDGIGECVSIEDVEGSWYFEFVFDPAYANLLVSKGSISVNGTSLTVVQPSSNSFKIAIIPYTFEHTNFKTLKIGDKVNLEFDIIGKYVQRYMDRIND